MTKVLFVCLGNICRSAMADAIFHRLVKQAGVQDRYQIDSAGLNYEEIGNPPYPPVRKLLSQHGYDYSYLRARHITPRDYHWADYIIGMDAQNVATLKEHAPAGCLHKIHLCMNIMPGHHGQEIPDPWYTRRFNYTYQVLTEVLPLWLRYFQAHAK